MTVCQTLNGNTTLNELTNVLDKKWSTSEY